MAKAKWTTKPTEVVATSADDGSFHAEVPLYDGGVKQLTVTFDIDADRVLTVFVNGEPTGTITGFYAWSDL